MSGTTSPSRANVPWGFVPLVVGSALLALLAFAQGGTDQLPGQVALLALAVAIFVLVPVPLRLWCLPLLGLSALLGQVARGVSGFELVLPSIVVAACVVTLSRGEREAWDVHRPGLLALAFVSVPLLALPRAVVSLHSYLGQYKVLLVYALVFLALRRLTPPRRSNVLLWIFPLMGAIGALQMLAKTSGLGGLVFSRLKFRNFYTVLPWGQSDFISATLEFCLCMTVVLFLLDRRPLARAILIAAAIPMFQGFLMLFSRGGAVALLFYLLILAVGLGGRNSLVAAGVGGTVAVLGLLSEGGQVLLGRFTDPSEYASWYHRLLVWSVSWHRFVTHFWTGIGLNQGKYQGDMQGELTSHNMLLDFVADQGIFGGILILVIIYAAYRMSLRVRPPGTSGSPRAVRVALVAALSQLFVHALVEPVLQGPTVSIGFVYLLAWLSLNAGAKDPPRTA